MALTLTQSRGALVALALASLVYLRLLRTPTLITPSRTLPAVLLAVRGGHGGQPARVLGRATLQRFGEAEVNLGSRIAYYRATWEAMQERPLLGTGYGTYADAFGAYNHSGTGTYFLDKAHNTYLQLIMELGHPLAAPGRRPRVWWCSGVLRGRKRRKRRIWPRSSSCSVLVGVHPLVDFSLEMPANAFTFPLLLGLGARARALENASSRCFAWITPRIESSRSDLTFGALRERGGSGR